MTEAERIVVLEAKFHSLEQEMERLRGYVRGVLDSLNNDVVVTARHMDEEITRLDKLLRGEHGDNGLMFAIRMLEKGEGRRARRDWAIFTALISILAYLIGKSIMGVGP